MDFLCYFGDEIWFCAWKANAAWFKCGDHYSLVSAVMNVWMNWCECEVIAHSIIIMQIQHHILHYGYTHISGLTDTILSKKEKEKKRWIAFSKFFDSVGRNEQQSWFGRFFFPTK